VDTSFFHFSLFFFPFFFFSFFFLLFSFFFFLFSYFLIRSRRLLNSPPYRSSKSRLQQLPSWILRPYRWLMQVSHFFIFSTFFSFLFFSLFFFPFFFSLFFLFSFFFFLFSFFFFLFLFSFFFFLFFLSFFLFFFFFFFSSFSFSFLFLLFFSFLTLRYLVWVYPSHLPKLENLVWSTFKNYFRTIYCTWMKIYIWARELFSCFVTNRYSLLW
jgi:hypothetical protein